MNFIKKFALASTIFIAALSAAPVIAQPSQVEGFTYTGSTNTTGPYAAPTNQWVVIPRRTALQPVVQNVEARLIGADMSNILAQVYFYNAGETEQDERSITTAAAASATLLVTSSNSLAAANICVLEYATTPKTYQRLTVSNVAENAVSFYEPFTAAVTTNAKLFKMNLAGVLMGGTVAVPQAMQGPRDKIAASGQAVFVGVRNRPSLVDVVAQSAPRLNVVSGRFGFGVQ